MVVVKHERSRRIWTAFATSSTKAWCTGPRSRSRDTHRETSVRSVRIQGQNDHSKSFKWVYVDGLFPSPISSEFFLGATLLLQSGPKSSHLSTLSMASCHRWPRQSLASENLLNALLVPEGSVHISQNWMMGNFTGMTLAKFDGKNPWVSSRFIQQNQSIEYLYIIVATSFGILWSTGSTVIQAIAGPRSRHRPAIGPIHRSITSESRRTVNGVYLQFMSFEGEKSIRIDENHGKMMINR